MYRVYRYLSLHNSVTRAQFDIPNESRAEGSGTLTNAVTPDDDQPQQ